MIILVKDDEFEIKDVDLVTLVYPKDSLLDDYPYQKPYWQFGIRANGVSYFYTYLTKADAESERLSVLEQMRGN